MPPSQISVASMGRESYPHVIRLRGPWQIHTTPGMSSGNEDDAGPRTIQLPCDLCDLLEDDFCGEARLTRRFGLPTNLGADERVDLVVRAIDASGHVLLNGSVLGSLDRPSDVSRFDVTERLLGRNVLVIEVTDRADSTTDPSAKLEPPLSKIESVHLEVNLK